MRIENLKDEKYQLVTNSQDVKEIQNYLQFDAFSYDSFFVFAKDGEYLEIYGFHGLVPYHDKIVTKLL
jgi:hypothetical protein